MALLLMVWLRSHHDFSCAFDASFICRIYGGPDLIPQAICDFQIRGCAEEGSFNPSFYCLIAFCNAPYFH